VPDEVPDRDARLIAAAEAAASWARARRAMWTKAPLELAALPPEGPTETEIRQMRAAVSEPARGVTAPSQFTYPPGAARIAKPVRSFTAPLVPWLPLAAAVAVLAAAGYVVVPYAMNALSRLTTRTPVVGPTDAGPPGAAPKTTAGVRVTSTPAGAQVLIDGKARGVTPVTLNDLTPGRHEVALKNDSGTVRRTVTLAANETTTIEESIFSGWVAVLSPFEVTIGESGRALRPDERNQVMLPAGIHELRLTNRTLGYEAALQVEVKPGETTSVRLTPAPSTLTVTASEAAEVWLDGVRVGETPLNALAVPLGTHEIVVRRASGGERRSTVTIGVKPFALNVDF
jgi:PEGA domain-containing protein